MYIGFFDWYRFYIVPLLHRFKSPNTVKIFTNLILKLEYLK